MKRHTLTIFIIKILIVLTKSNTQDFDANKISNNQTFQNAKVDTRKTVCYEYVGCFDTNPPFNNVGFYVPVSPNVLKTKFSLYRSSKNMKITDTLSYFNESSIKNSRYNKNFALKVVIHGFQNTGQTPWVLDLAKNLLIAVR